MVDLTRIPKKWQDKWEKAKIFEVHEDPKKKKFYLLEMYPYPSASGLHMGHARNYIIGDSFARYKRMKGFNVLYPMGYDSFGLPAENAAIKAKSHPKIFTENAIKNFIRQQKELGLSYDWTRTLACHQPEYYKWDQWIFLQLFKKGLAYKKKAAVNWCPECNTVLANEQVIQGKCWRHTETNVEIKELNQWFFKITDYAERLLNDIDNLTEWPEDIKIMQRNWIGRSPGTLVNFKVKGGDKAIPIFTTRPDTLFGVTFMVYAPEHPDVMELVKGTKQEKQVREFINKVILEERFQRTAEDTEKEGMFIGRYAINPVNGAEIPIYIANFVLLEYGTGAIMAVPAHDQRDFEFAKKYQIPIKVVINPHDYDLNAEKMSRAYISEGVLVNSGEFNGSNNLDAIEEINDYLEKKKLGKRTVQYKLRDWLISRQRMWGAPIPVIYCPTCGIVPVPEKDLPVKLPDKIKLTFEKGNPLENVPEFVNVKCPLCGEQAKRETDTMDTFVDSSWYFLRYCDAKNDKKIFDSAKVNYWLPIDQYIGGREHATGHLIYFRFFTKFFKDLGIVDFDEPALRLFNQGMLHKDGFVMSKSRGNVITQEEIAAKYGIDTARFFLLFVASPGKDMEWNDETVEGTFRFLNRVYKLLEKKLRDKADRKELSIMNKTIKEITEDIDNFRLNLAMIKIMEYADYLAKQDEISKESLRALVLLMSPVAPHLAEEMWEQLGEKPFVCQQKWPEFNEKLIDEKIEESMNVLDKTLSDIRQVLTLTKITEPKKITLFVAEEWKYQLIKKLKAGLAETRDIGALMKKVMDKEHGKDISSLVPKLVKDESKIPAVVLDEKTEFNSLKEAAEKIGREFKCAVEVAKAQDSKENKARQAMPSKPAILVA